MEITANENTRHERLMLREGITPDIIRKWDETYDWKIWKVNNMQALSAAGREYRFNPHGLSEEEQEYVIDIAEETINKTNKRIHRSIEACHFFSETGYDFLAEAVSRSGMKNPCIRGDDENCFDQHYWLSFDVPAGTVIIDPVWNYVGLEKHSRDILDYSHAAYYTRQRKVIPHKPRHEGGVKLNTMSV